MQEKPVEQIYSDYLYTELEYIRKRIDELTNKSFKFGHPEIPGSTELEALYKKEAYYILQLANLKGVIKPTIN